MPAQRVCWIDALLPPALARWLSAHGAVARHLMELDLLGTPDEEMRNVVLLALFERVGDEVCR